MDISSFIAGLLVYAAPVVDQSEEPRCEPTLGAARLVAGRDLYARGSDRFEQEDYLGAIEAWEQVLLLMPEKEDDLRVPLAHAYRGAYSVDGDSQHLIAAYALLDAQLAILAPDDVARADIELELSEVEAELVALAAAEARAKAEREQEIRQEQIRLKDQALAQAEIQHQHNIQKVFYGVGGSMAGIGVGSLAAMTAFLIDGQRLEREGYDMANATPVDHGYYQDQLAKGVARNRSATVAGIVGGVLVAAGTSLLVVGAVRHKRIIAKREKKVVLTPTIGGLVLQWR